mmetsp:Transcript_26803/g.104092  ORF Transcript_26803/g.104092 Transcript_26803/m.104092 type:complete len:185 (-) Transcript_26803:921-1475(-)|eukprot:CAMPEP_0113962408 /NCGR_PEP_ID=MMETSP0011_2-20120614/5897_1 /TAXON_ID=101924 /ORGANISM="Rhodosorus marinus" /LENGTH=184 /DNA_ID=CAMNT_0000974255 /DNA_START=329 /DNA_END=883 /DNA_ORIENTATION=+ /assembly_acc=CAM_ASM_000156
MENRRTLAVLGARGVGKSSVVERFCYNRFYDNYNPTIMAMEHVTLKIDGKQYQCDIMDPAGQDDFSTLGPNVTIGVHGYILVFSVKERGSFEMIPGLNSNLLVALSGQKVPTLLVGNQSDCAASERQVSLQEGKQLGKELKINYVECSAKSGEGVKEVFVTLLRDVNRTIADEVVDEGFKCSIS